MHVYRAVYIRAISIGLGTVIDRLRVRPTAVPRKSVCVPRVHQKGEDDAQRVVVAAVALVRAVLDLRRIRRDLQQSFLVDLWIGARVVRVENIVDAALEVFHLCSNKVFLEVVRWLQAVTRKAS